MALNETRRFNSYLSMFVHLNHNSAYVLRHEVIFISCAGSLNLISLHIFIYYMGIVIVSSS